ncbi:MAG: stage II sporulation protein P [Clostridia bacterium]|nr:stage II sporulation protein P [Clostridia bacterium]
MAKFRVIKGGTVLLVVALVVLAAVLAVVLISAFGKNDVDMAVSPVLSHSAALIPVPYGGENEHTDSIVSAPGDIVSRVLPSSNGKRILIYHTHTHEAYEMAYEGEYDELEKWRTDDNDHNVVRVGEELASLLIAHGFEVVHDATDHEQNDLSTAYMRSLETLSGRQAEEYDLYIDLHRDAYTEGAALTSSYAGKNAAKLMVLIGKGENFTEKPFFAENYELAANLTDAVNQLCPGLCRDVMVKTGRYNQHIAPNSLLIEAGSNMNTLEEALAAMPVLADAINNVMNDSDSGMEIITVANEIP